MPILNFHRLSIGLTGVEPGLIQIETDDTITEITATGYLNNLVSKQKFPLKETDVALVSTKASPSAKAVSGVYEVAKTGDNWSLLASGQPGTVTLPTLANEIAVFENATGGIISGASSIFNSGNISAGQSGTAGYLSSFPGTASKGSFRFQGANNTGDTVNTLTHAECGQATTWTLADPAGAASKVLQAPGALVSGNVLTASGTDGLAQDGGFSVLANTTEAYGGGGTSNAFTATGLTANSIVTAVILASTNSVAIAKAVPSADTLTVTFTADPGASTTVSWIAITPAV